MKYLLLGSLLFLLGISHGPAAQTSTTPTRDPLMSLMLSSPAIDVDSPVVPTAGFDPPMVEPGQMATYSVMLNALESSVEMPTNLPAPPKLELRPGAHGQMMALSGPKLQPHTCFNFHVRAAEAGHYVIPEFKLKVYDREVTVPAAQLEVVTSPSNPIPPAPQLALELPQTNLYAGQSILAVLRFPPAPNGQLFLPAQMPPIQVHGQGFVLDYASLRQHIEQATEENHSGSGPALVYEANLTPIAIGTFPIWAQSFVGNRFSGGGPIVISGPHQVLIPGGPPQYTLLESDPVQVRVRPLPREGRLPGFTGAVGKLSVDSPTLSDTELRVGDMLRLMVRVEGDPNSNLARVVPPRPPQVRDWQVFAVPGEMLPPQALRAQHFVTFTYAMVPLSDSVRTTPRIPFSCFDPDRGAYVDLSIPAMPVTVKPAAGPVDVAALRRANIVAQPEKEPTLSGLAASAGFETATLVPALQRIWFALVLLLPALAFVGLWLWDRRRRYLQEHPELVLRRRARRALRRERRVLQRAARTGDAAGFTTSAVRAMRVASAPHYPAEPRALVGRDVLELLPPIERSGRPGQAVQRFFAVNDAAQFGRVPGDGHELLPLEPDLAQVLQRLEENL